MNFVLQINQVSRVEYYIVFPFVFINTLGVKCVFLDHVVLSIKNQIALLGNDNRIFGCKMNDLLCSLIT